MDKSEISEIRKRGEWYTVKGHVDGRPSSFEVPAGNFEKMSSREARDYAKRGLASSIDTENS